MKEALIRAVRSITHSIDSANNALKVLLKATEDELVNKVLDVLPDFEFKGGKPFYPSANCDPNILFGVATVELRWQYPSMMRGHFIIDFQTSDDPLSYRVYIDENHYHKTAVASGTFESLCSDIAHEFQKFCMDY